MGNLDGRLTFCKLLESPWAKVQSQSDRVWSLASLALKVSARSHYLDKAHDIVKMEFICEMKKQRSTTDDKCGAYKVAISRALLEVDSVESRAECRWW